MNTSYLMAISVDAWYLSICLPHSQLWTGEMREGSWE
jgi:hypothetical protein